MGEAACLRRSFSNPSQISNEFSEGDPIRALGESISFGRYMSETLDWEKWSAFSQNRYLEEAEKTSKPGSVAKMKAYFEAHYKKIGAQKQASLEQANNASSYIETEVENSHNMELVSNSSSPLVNEVKTANEFPNKEIPNVEPFTSVLISSCDSSNKTKHTQEHGESIVESISDSDFIQNQVVQEQVTELSASIIESCVEIKIDQSLGSTKDNIVTPETQVIVEKEGKEDKWDPRSKRKSEDSSLRSTKKSNMSKLSSSLARLATPVRPKKESSAMESIEKTKSTSKLVQKSINLNSDIKQVKKASPTSHKTGIGKVFTPFAKMMRKSVIHTPAPSTSRASINTNSVSRHPSATPLSESRRSRIALEKSFNKTKTSDQRLQSPSVGNIKSQAPSSITFSPFSFRTEERAAKRKEFLERRLEKEAENFKLLNKTKVKSKADFRKLYQSVNFSHGGVDIKKEVLSDKTKIPLARAQPPKSETKPSSNLMRGKSSKPPQSEFESKPASGNSKSIPATLPTKKKRHENTSPNIL